MVARIHAVVHCLSFLDRSNGFSTHIPRGTRRALFRWTGLHNIVRQLFNLLLRCCEGSGSSRLYPPIYGVGVYATISDSRVTS